METQHIPGTLLTHKQCRFHTKMPHVLMKRSGGCRLAKYYHFRCIEKYTELPHVYILTSPSEVRTRRTASPFQQNVGQYNTSDAYFNKTNGL